MFHPEFGFQVTMGVTVPWLCTSLLQDPDFGVLFPIPNIV